jgi:hypothetical protein
MGPSAATRRNGLDQWINRGAIIVSLGLMTSAMALIGWIVMRAFA